jgi:transposase
VARIVEATLQTKPEGATHWSTRSLARAQGVSKNTIQRVWQEHELKPHLTKGFKLSRDPRFLEKLTDVVGVYLTPPQNAVVLCVDEKSQIQALDRTQPGLPLNLDNYGTHGHERVQRWLAKHPRFVLHFIPTSSSWLNLVERWFGELSPKAVRRGVFRSVEDLEEAIENFMRAWNANPTPFVWTASVEKILDKLARCRRRLEQIQPGCTAPKRRNKCAVI